MTQFSDLALDPKVLQAVTEAGYTTPTPIQAGAIPPALEGRDVLGIAQTGTGKTASFTLPMITLLGRGRARARMPRSLVLCPTRELAAQVAENFDIYAKHTRLTKALLIGGVSMKDQELLINRGVDVLIATPGRLLDHFERGNLLLQGVQIMVVDEADRMLDMGFIPDIERIFQLTPFTRQTLFFSATMAPEIERITDTFLHAPVRIEVARQATTSDTITQKLVEITPTRKDQTAKQKRELLRAVIREEERAEAGLKNAIIFCNRKTEVDIVAKSLKAHGFDAAPIHGDLDQAQRMRTLDGFRTGTLRFLVASDVAARGLDIPAVSHVFNFDLPSHAEDYVHRIGRTGRAGRQGTAISIAVPADEKYLAAIESLVKQALPRANPPEGFALSEAAREAPVAREGRDGRDRERGPRSRSRGLGRRGEDERRAEARPPASTRPLDVVPSAEPQAEGRSETRPERSETRQERSDNRPERRDTRPDQNRDARRDGGRGERDRARDDRREDRREDRRDDRREDRRGDRREGRDERRGQQGGPAVLGLGDHVPDFLSRTFRVGYTTPAETAATAATATIEADTPAEAPRRERRDEGGNGNGRGRRSRRGRGRGERGAPASSTGVEEVIALEAQIEAEAEAQDEAALPLAAEAAEPLPEAHAAPETALPDAAPALVAVTLPDLEAEPVSEPVLAETAAPVDFEAEAAKPRRSRARPKAEADAAAASDAAPANPRRRTRARAGDAAPGDAAPAADALPVAVTEALAAPAEPAKRPRRRKAEAAGEAPVAAPAEAPEAKPRRTRARRKADDSPADTPSDV